MIEDKKLTSLSYWENGYRQRREQYAIPDVNNFRQLPLRRVIELIESLNVEKKQILEVGAGDSDILLTLAERNAKDSKFIGLDYTETGCQLLKRRALKCDVDIDVVQADLFQPPESMISKFDIVYSFGLVEHFENLSDVLLSIHKFVKPGGNMVSIIPNMHGLMGWLTKKWNKDVYDVHNPHSLDSLRDGHLNVNSRIIDSGYICSSNFGVLSSCFSNGNNIGENYYVWLSRLSKAAWWVESKTVDFPHTAFLSPYIFVVIKK